ncbi:MAG: hypothetical protein JRE28_02860 [Deltaproteobacteria bacterium]|nr:hypothetical protein [Deltaproteobacteria bacterium]
MEEKTANNDFAERNIDPRNILNKYYSVQFSISGHDPVYMFKLRDFSYNGLCILVKEESDALKCLKVNETIRMEYNPSASQGTSKFLKTRISDIKKNDHGGFTGHFLVGLSIIE